MNERLKAQKAHGFYDEVDAFRNEIKAATLEKAAVKYPEPFNPANWTGDELATHAMAENYDQSVYITGLRDKLREQNNDILRLEKELEIANNAAEYWRLRYIKEAGKVTTVEVVLKSPQVFDVKALEDAIGKMDKRFKNDARNF